MSGQEFDRTNGRKQVKMAGYSMPLPASRIARTLLGGSLVVGGFLSFLPVLGLWMLPLGLIVLSVDFAAIRRRRRRAELWLAKRRTDRRKNAKK